jgi:hypothetical protein
MTFFLRISQLMCWLQWVGHDAWRGKTSDAPRILFGKFVVNMKVVPRERVSKKKNELKILVGFGIGSVSASDIRELEAWSIYYASLPCDFV